MHILWKKFNKNSSHCTMQSENIFRNQTTFKESRDFLRETINLVKKIDFDPKIQLLFVFGLPKFATNSEFAQIKTENEQYQDMIIPSKYKLKITCYSKKSLQHLRY